MLDSGYSIVTLVRDNRKENEADTHEVNMLSLVQMEKGGITCEQAREELGRERA